MAVFRNVLANKQLANKQLAGNANGDRLPRFVNHAQAHVCHGVANGALGALFRRLSHFRQGKTRCQGAAHYRFRWAVMVVNVRCCKALAVLTVSGSPPITNTCSVLLFSVLVVSSGFSASMPLMWLGVRRSK